MLEAILKLYHQESEKKFIWVYYIESNSKEILHDAGHAIKVSIVRNKLQGQM